MKKNKTVELSTMIGKGSKFKGELYVDGGIRVDGEIEGKLEAKGFVAIGVSGKANADIIAQECLVSGKVKGDISVKEVLELDKTANVNGDVVAKTLMIHSGAKFNGTSTMNGIKKSENEKERTE